MIYGKEKNILDKVAKMIRTYDEFKINLKEWFDANSNHHITNPRNDYNSY